MSTKPGTGAVDSDALRRRVEEHIRRHELIEPGGDVTALVSGGPDSTCLWHVARRARLPGLTPSTSTTGSAVRSRTRTPRFCRDVLGAEIVEAPPPARPTEDALRELRYSFARDRLRATGHTASDQVETVLYRLVASGATKAIKPKREDGVVRPAAAALARGDRGLLSRRGARVPQRQLQRRHDARPHPRRDPPASAAPPPGGRAQPAPAGRAARRRSSTGSSPRAPARSASTSGTASPRCANTTASGSSRRRSPSRERPLGSMAD